MAKLKVKLENADGDTLYPRASLDNIVANKDSETLVSVPILTNGKVLASTLPPATTSTLGAVKVGNNLQISADGTLSATAEGGTGGTTYNAGTGIDISNDTISIDLNAGTGIEISGNTITCTAEGGTATAGTYPTNYSRDRLKQYQHENYYSGSLMAIIDDDGYHNFLDAGIADLYRTKGVRCSIAVVACRAETTTGTTTSGDPYTAMSWNELSLLAKDGFEILNHSYSHDRNVFPNTSSATVDQYIYEYEESLKLFYKNGFNPRTIVYPWGNPKALGSGAARKYFEYGVLYHNDTNNGIVNFGGNIDYIRIPRSARTSLADIKAEIDDCAANNRFYVLGTHSYQTGPSPSVADLSEILDYAIGKGIRIEPFERAMRLRKPALDVGTANNSRITILGDGTFNDLFVTRLISRATELGLLNGTIIVTGVTVTGSDTITNSGTLTVTVTPNNATNPAVTWTSSDTEVATVNGGTVTVVSDGTCTITATATDGSGVSGSKSITCALEAILVTGITVNGDSTITDSGVLTATVTPNNASNPAVTWTSSDDTIATVNGGTVTVVSSGTVSITATATDGSGVTGSKSITCVKTIAVTGVTISGSTAITDSGVLTATVSPENANQGVTWESSDTSIAIVNGGTVTVLDDGTCTITATSVADTTKSDAKQITCAVTPPSIEITSNPSYLAYTDGTTSSGTLTATTTTGNAITWTSSDTDVATIGSTTGAVIVLGDGAVTFTANDGASNAHKTIACVKDGTLVDLTGKAGYIPNWTAFDTDVTNSIYIDFVLEKVTGTASTLFSDNNTRSSLLLMRPNSISNALRLTVKKSTATNFNYINTSTSSNDPTGSHEHVLFVKSVAYSWFTDFDGDTDDFTVSEGNAPGTPASILGLNVEFPSSMAGMTSEQLAAAIAGGTITLKSGTKTVKLKRLIIYKNEDKTSAASALADAASAYINIIGTPDGRLIDLNRANDQPVISA